MAKTAMLPDGGCRVIFDANDVIDIVEEYAGKDVAEAIRSEFKYIDAIRKESEELACDNDELIEDIHQLESENEGLKNELRYIRDLAADIYNRANDRL